MIYAATCKGEEGSFEFRFLFRANLSEASAPIATWHPDDKKWVALGLQTADARHNQFEAARLVFDAYWSDGEPADIDTVDEDVADPAVRDIEWE